TTVTPQQSDLSLTESVDNPTPLAGADVTFTISLSNVGPDPATGVQISIPLPAGLTFVSSSPGAGSYDSATGVWTVGDVAVGEPIVLQVVAHVVSGDPSTVTASISHADQADPQPAGNTVSVTVTPQLADIGVAVVVNNPTPNVGDTVTFTITLT